jgi:hypothetical protein
MEISADNNNKICNWSRKRSKRRGSWWRLLISDLAYEDGCLPGLSKWAVIWEIIVVCTPKGASGH